MNSKLHLPIGHFRTSRREIFLQILFVFIVPVALMKMGIIPLSFRVPLIVVIVTILTILLVSFEGWTPRAFGLHKGDIKKYAIPYLLFTLIMALILVTFGEYILKYEELKRWWTHQHFLYLFFVVSLFQEIAYRGYLIPALSKLSRNIPMIIFANALIFTFLHIIFPNPMIGLPVAFVGGFGFAIMYIRYPNLPLIILSHSVLNFCAVLYGFFVIPGATH